MITAGEVLLETIPQIGLQFSKWNSLATDPANSMPKTSWLLAIGGLCISLVICARRLFVLAGLFILDDCRTKADGAAAPGGSWPPAPRPPAADTQKAVEAAVEATPSAEWAVRVDPPRLKDALDDADGDTGGSQPCMLSCAPPSCMPGGEFDKSS